MFFAIDIDGVLAQDTNGYARYLNSYFSLGLANEVIDQIGSYLEFTQLPVVKKYAAQSEDACKRINEVAKQAQYLAEIQEQKVPVPGSLSSMQEIAKRYPFCYVTARKSETIEITQQWLARYGFPDPSHVFCCDQGIYQKYLYAHQLAESEPIVMIDDLALRMMKAFATVIKYQYAIAKAIRPKLALYAFGHEQSPVWPFKVAPFPVWPLPNWQQFDTLIGVEQTLS